MWTNLLTTSASDLGPASIVLRLTAIILLLRPMGPWWVAPFILSIAALALISPRVLFAPGTWYTLAILVAARIIEDWPLADNHIYLLAYWCLAIGLALGSRDGIVDIRRASRLLIGLAFLFAVIWKVALSPDFLDGRFFRVTFLMDPRFENVVLLTGGMTPAQLAESREYLMPLVEGAVLVDEPTLDTSPRFEALVYVSTWGTVFIEAVCALFFLIPLTNRSAVFQHLLLLMFCLVTYALAPVAGFGWLLLTMGIATVDADSRSMRGAYISAWILVLLYDEIPLAGLLVDWFRLAQ
ncbi:MAG: hypothetical protein H7070_00345 [Saprospiraceae bacterium]|nr:hypothetical protein [Pyrinomonadaceae bacterium]